MASTRSDTAPGKSTTPMQPPKIPTTENSDGPKSVGELAEKVLREITVVGRTAVDVAEREAEIQRQRDRAAQVKRFQAWFDFIERRGARYANCRLTNFECVMPKQTTVINKLTDYADHIGERISAGEGVVLYGSRGTGKDHLAVSVCREAVRADVDVYWVNGMDFFGKLRDAMDNAKMTEAELIRSLAVPQLLYISDPVPPTGNLTDFQQSSLFRVLDARYSMLRPCIVTVNAANGKELDERLGPQNADRIRDGALAIHCDWPSHRRAKQ